jgi:hypothetical protein
MKIFFFSFFITTLRKGAAVHLGFYCIKKRQWLKSRLENEYNFDELVIDWKTNMLRLTDDLCSIHSNGQELHDMAIDLTRNFDNVYDNKLLRFCYEYLILNIDINKCLDNVHNPFTFSENDCYLDHILEYN